MIFLPICLVSGTQDSILTPYQRTFLAAFQKAGFKEGEARVIGGIGKRTEIPLTKAE
jgi:hypothetical protein